LQNSHEWSTPLLGHYHHQPRCLDDCRVLNKLQLAIVSSFICSMYTCFPIYVTWKIEFKYLWHGRMLKTKQNKIIAHQREIIQWDSRRNICCLSQEGWSNLIPECCYSWAGGQVIQFSSHPLHLKTQGSQLHEWNQAKLHQHVLSQPSGKQKL
jgi:hypothetical protein